MVSGSGVRFAAVNQKGGTGKTTVATNLATLFTTQGPKCSSW
jgi:cellulose biosynthesis protein BcsQ